MLQTPCSKAVALHVMADVNGVTELGSGQSTQLTTASLQGAKRSGSRILISELCL